MSDLDVASKTSRGCYLVDPKFSRGRNSEIKHCLNIYGIDPGRWLLIEKITKNRQCLGWFFLNVPRLVETVCMVSATWNATLLPIMNVVMPIWFGFWCCDFCFFTCRQCCCDFWCFLAAFRDLGPLPSNTVLLQIAGGWDDFEAAVA